MLLRSIPDSAKRCLGLELIKTVILFTIFGKEDEYSSNFGFGNFLHGIFMHGNFRFGNFGLDNFVDSSFGFGNFEYVTYEYIRVTF